MNAFCRTLLLDSFDVYLLLNLRTQPTAYVMVAKMNCKLRFAVLLSCLILFTVVHSDTETDEVENFFKSGHTNNWAVLVCTSRFWFNYRHVANALSLYRSVKRLGIPDSHIILMLADDMACNARNPRPAAVFNNARQHINVYGDDIEVDYRGYEVTVENFIRVLTGRLPPGTPRSKRLLSDDRSNILIYMTGHGGDGFLKFQDAEEISNVELADAFQQMWQKQRYHELLFIVDTCQANSMYQRFYSPNLIGIGSSQVGEDSLSHHVDPAIGVYVIDRYTYHALEFLELVSLGSTKKMGKFFEVCPWKQCKSTPGVRTDLFQGDARQALVTDFFGNVRNIEITTTKVSLQSMKAAEVEEMASRDAGRSTTPNLKYPEIFPKSFDSKGKDKEKGLRVSQSFVLLYSAFIVLAGITFFTNKFS
ncbi:GPI-anchor transamidase-like [Anneissia japonica]|uniref:GPI-anchor transamidase-like n=1 Tax=Anneissia japonica TaxID=1529436 RepID=UPI0014258754|nr:GPI-anchor transamidase-like [Anneissia japonica]